VLSGWWRLAKEFPAFLRLYGHPKLLAIASSVCGEDFVPSGGGESIQLMEPFIGSASAWHQDGTSHFGSQWGELENEHGFNFMVQLYGSTPANAVYAVPASHHEGRSDIAALVSEHGERLKRSALYRYSQTPVTCSSQTGAFCMARSQIRDQIAALLSTMVSTAGRLF
jgi:hypothetical protein